MADVQTLERQVSDAYLAAVGVGRRYRIASWAEITPELRDDVAAYCQNIDQHMRDGYGLTLVGGVGTGKTCALVLVADAALAVRWPYGRYGDQPVTKPATVEWMLGPVLYRILHRPDQRHHRERIAAFEAADLLIIDDFDRLYATEWDVMQLEALMELRHSEKRSVCLSLNSLDLLRQPELERTLDRLRENSDIVQLADDVQSRRGG
ncbi:MAG: hypothetical protein U9R79_05950 [Armatimonadota bacterium]|nr:hypothetical protein [Armatimonadota bacterium]